MRHPYRFSRSLPPSGWRCSTNATSVAMGQGTYTLTIVLDDGTSRSVNINLIK